MHIGAYSHRGDRQINQDNYFINRQVGGNFQDVFTQASAQIWSRGHLLCGVFDGIGGGKMGEAAALLGAQVGVQWSATPFSPEGFTQQANQAICDLRALHQFSNIGTTAVICQIRHGRGHLYHLGDSPCYRWRYRDLECLTTAHSQYVDLLQRHVVKQHLGLFDHEQILSPEWQDLGMVQRGDIYVLCSDGVSTQISPAIFCDILKQHNTAKAMAEAFVTQAITMERSDNATALVVKI